MPAQRSSAPVAEGKEAAAESAARPSPPTDARPEAGVASAARPRTWWRRALPFLLATLLVGYVLSRVDWASFWSHVAQVNYPAYLAFMILFVPTLLLADALATTHVYRRTVAPVAYREVLIVRGASYLPSMLNFHIGQAWLTYFMSKAYDVKLSRMAGATLLVYATWAGCVLGLGCIAVIASGMSLGWLGLGLGAGVAYLVLLALQPKALRQRRVIAPLFEAGVVGHARAILWRLPHVAVVFCGNWLPFMFFGVDIPLSAALTYVPIMLVALTLPLTPQGFGTRDILAALFFQQFVVLEEATEAQRLAAVAAATTTTGVVATIIAIGLGLLLLPAATRLLHAPKHASPT